MIGWLVMVPTVMHIKEEYNGYWTQGRVHAPMPRSCLSCPTNQVTPFFTNIPIPLFLSCPPSPPPSLLFQRPRSNFLGYILRRSLNTKSGPGLMGKLKKRISESGSS